MHINQEMLESLNEDELALLCYLVDTECNKEEVSFQFLKSLRKKFLIDLNNNNVMKFKSEKHGVFLQLTNKLRLRE